MKYLCRINGMIADPYEDEVMAEMVEYGEAVFWKTCPTFHHTYDYYVLPEDDRAV